MPRSMTGFGRGSSSAGGVSVTVEVRSVNNRFLDVQVRAPREYMSFEPGVLRRVKSELARGRVEVHVRRVADDAGVRVQADAALARRYMDAIESLGQDASSAPSADVVWAYLLSQPAVVTATVDQVEDGEEVVVQRALGDALAALSGMRRVEGDALVVELRKHANELRQTVRAIAADADGVAERIQAKLEARLARLVEGHSDDWRVAQEVALMADRCDIAEELVRLESHLDQFDEALRQDAPIGRRLEFLLQEMHRESNTIGSKAVEHPVSHRVVDLKATLERMREQSANVE